ncbi:hypothetical protein GCM10023219_06030 [Stakelama sediminis]|nr:DOMON-like domain-containing protein [Stakelama sediminis]
MTAEYNPGTQILHAHPASPARRIDRVECALSSRDDGIRTLRYAVHGDIAALVVPEQAAPERTDELWKTICFELFVRAGEGEAYQEFNLSPSSHWAAYGFDGYRSGMHDLRVNMPPMITCNRGESLLELTAQVDLSCLPKDIGWRISLSAVMEEVDGTKSYWALAHPPGKPDFHHPACFVLELPAA